MKKVLFSLLLFVEINTCNARINTASQYILVAQQLPE